MKLAFQKMLFAKLFKLKDLIFRVDIKIYLPPIYQEKIAYGDKGFPWTADFSRKDISYARGICPNAEELNEFSYIGFGMCTYEWSNQDVNLIIDTFHKVWNGLDELRDL